MPSDLEPAPPERTFGIPDYHLRRAVWIALAVAFTVAAAVHASKAADDRGAIVRWQHQLADFWDGENIWDKYMFPNPPIFAITITPFISLPPVACALAWFAFKCALAGLSVLFCFRMARDAEPARTLPSWVQGLVLLVSFRPILSDLHHANNNLLILFCVVAALYAWRKGYDVLAGLVLGLAITYKVTPALFVVYFAWKGQWRTVAATMVGIGLFLLVVPSLILGPVFNWECLAMWYHRILRPYVESNESGHKEINQSMIGVVMRILTEQRGGDGRYSVAAGLNWLALDPKQVILGLKAASVGMVALLLGLCRLRPSMFGLARAGSASRTDPRLLGEFSLVVLTMLFVSERSWKHHYVTILLPCTYLAVRLWGFGLSRRERIGVGAGLAAATLLMLTTSSEAGGLFFDGRGHKLAQYYGMFFWSGVALYVATAWRVAVERSRGVGPEPGSPAADAAARALPAPHLVVEAARPAPAA